MRSGGLGSVGRSANDPSRPRTFACDGLAFLPVLPARLALGGQAAWRAPLEAAAFVRRGKLRLSAPHG